MDCSITETGKSQSELTAVKCSELNIKYVFVSPLRRTLQTCMVVFKNHKNSPKIWAHPLLREWQRSCGDIGSSVDVLEKEFPEVDFTMVKVYEKPHLWFLYQMRDVEFIKSVLEQVQENVTVVEEEGPYAKLLLLQRMKELYPTCLEDGTDVVKRAKQALEDIVERMKELGDDGEVCVVGHCLTLLAITSKKFDEEMGFVDGVRLNNAELFYYKLQ